jgi:ribosomal protein S27E
MVMQGQKGYAVKCTECGHEDAVFFRKHIDSLKELAFKLKGKKCPKCGGTMKVDPGKQIVF